MTPEEIERSRASRLPQLPVGQPLLERLGRWLLGGPRPAVTISDGTVGGAAGPLPARWYRPPNLRPDAPVLVYFHGGGWTVGAAAHYDWLCSSIAEDVGAVVVSVDYRLAPEDPAPAAADDAIAAMSWVAENRQEIGATGPLAVAGDSAGGNLAAVAAIAARDSGLDLAGQVLIYPGVDLTLSFRSVHVLTNEPILTRQDIDTFRMHYLSGGIDPADPRVSPWFADVAGVAPALVQTASHDPLVDEGDAYARKLEEAGVLVRHTRYVDVPHGFLSLPGIVPAARQALSEIVTFLTERTTRT